MIAQGEASSPLQIRVVNQAGLSEPRVQSLLADFRTWGERVYSYLNASHVAPLRLVLTNDAGYGYYSQGSLYIPPADRDEMLETWVHELAHHVTGHNSSFFFKEGIASHTLEALFASADRIPQGWPQYGVPIDAWVHLFRKRGELPPLTQALAGSSAWRQRDDGREADFRSWQIYLIGASFSGWYLQRYGHAAFQQAFTAKRPAQPLAELEKLWLQHLDARKYAEFDPARHLPPRERYRYFARRLGG